MNTQEELRDISSKIKLLIEDMDYDSHNQILEDAMNYFCSQWDIREGMKYAIRLTIDDQIGNHLSEQEIGQYRKLLEILTSKHND